MKKRQMYFVQQKLMGLAIVALAILTVVILEGDATAALIITPIGFMLIFTKKMFLMNRYFFEVQETKRRKLYK